MNTSAGYLPPGTVVAVSVNYYGAIIEHVGLVSDWQAHDGPGVIHNSKQADRQVVETSWSEFLRDQVPGTRPRVVPHLQPRIPVWQVLQRARSRLGCAWNLVTSNCEHFVRWALGHEEVSSPQLAWWAAVVLFFGAGVAAGVLLLRGK